MSEMYWRSDDTGVDVESFSGLLSPRMCSGAGLQPETWERVKRECSRPAFD